MGCNSCGTGSNGVPAGCNNNGSCGTGGCNKLSVFDWLGNMRLPDGQQPFEIVEIRFKNSRKEFFRNVNTLTLNVGDAVAVEAGTGYDIGVVSLTGELVKLQLKKRNVPLDSEEFKKVYRLAKQADLDKWKEARELEVPTMYKARTIALRLGLEMKLSDVEYQGDKTKATFYYTADARVDFRELIKVLAEEFRVRVEMRQIGARQEASRLGGIGSCGRELCCSTWLTDFRTVNTNAARYQQLSLNALKLAGQCGKLKCCLNYELDSYVDALKEFPDMEGKKLQTKKGDAFLQKTDIFRRMMWFSYRGEPGVFVPMRVEDVHEVIAANAKGELPEALKATVRVAPSVVEVEPEPVFENVVGQDSLTRFDQKKSQRFKHKQGKGKPSGDQQKQNKPQQKQGPKPADQPKLGQQEARTPRPQQNQGRSQSANSGQKRNDSNQRQQRPPANPPANPGQSANQGQQQKPRPQNNAPREKKDQPRPQNRPPRQQGNGGPNTKGTSNEGNA